MNGIGLLVLLAAVGQVGAAPNALLNREYGWEIDTRNPDKALCYIVQVSPTEAMQMERDGLEKESNMPPDLVGRATRIVVRIGTGVLPQTPPLEELRNMPRVNSPTDVTAGLGGGRLSDVEPSDVINVQQDRTGAPALPGLPLQSSTPSSAPRTDFGAQAQQGAENIIDQAKNLTRGLPGFPGSTTNPAASNGSATSPPLPGFNGLDRSGNSLSDNSNAGRQGQSTGANEANSWQIPPANSGRNRSREDAARIADNRFPNAAQDAPGSSSGAAYNQGNFDSNPNTRTPPSLDPGLMNGIPQRQTPSGTFGSYTGGQMPNKYANPTADAPNIAGNGQFAAGGQGYSGGQYNNNGVSFDPNYPGSRPNGGQFANNGSFRNDGVDRLAANNPGVPSSIGTNPGYVNTQPPGSAALGSGFQTGMGGTSARNNANANDPRVEDTSESRAQSATRSKTAENILPVFFLLSLVVNFYLGMLIRKLLTRYRALLANMRGQATPNAFGT